MSLTQAKEIIMKKTAYIIAPALLAAGLALTACSVSGKKEETTSSAAETTAAKSSEETTTAAETTSSSKSIGNENYVYAKINVPYADYYFGEINSIEPEEKPESLKPQLDKEDAAAPLREKGQYDAVSSVTPKKFSMYKTAYGEVVGEGSEIQGVANVNVAISKPLYEEAKKAIESSTTSKNPLLTLVGSISEVSDKVPSEYKVINSDGTLSKTIGTTSPAKDVKVELSTTSKYGNYEFELSDFDVEVDSIQGVLLETDDGKKYGLEHLENIWVNPKEFALAIADFKESHGNSPDFARYEDLPGKTIKKITYLLADMDDLEIDTSLYCKALSPAEYTITGDETANYNKEGTKVQANISTGEDKYALAYVLYRNEKSKLDIKADENGLISLPAEATPGVYQFVFSNDKLTDISFKTTINSGLTAEDFTFENNTLTLKENAAGLTIKNYLSSTTSAKVNDTELKGGRGRKFGSTAFNEDGSIKLDATVKVDEKDVPLFEAESSKVSIKADGYPDVEFEVKK